MKKYLLVALAMFAVASVQAEYSVNFLNPIDGGFQSGVGAINNLNQVVGHSYVGDPYFISQASSRATLWNSQSTYLPSQDIGGSGAGAINDLGQVAGFSKPKFGIWGNTATVWANGQASTLPGLGGMESGANGINNSGLIVGWAMMPNYPTPGAASHHAVSWYNGTVTDLGTLTGGTAAFATSVNNNGLIVGFSDSSKTGYRAVLWTGNTATMLGNLGGNGSYAYSINDSGKIVGISANANQDNRPVIWTDSGTQDLGTLGGSTGYAYDINSSGQIVGNSTASGSFSSRATLWANGSIYDLNNLVDQKLISEGWNFYSASSINDNGVIVGDALNSVTGIASSFMLTVTTPVPEPETYALMLAGLAVVGVGARRRKSAAMRP